VILTVEPGADVARIKRELTSLGQWVTELSSGSAMYLLLEPHSSQVSRETLRAIEGITALAERAPSHPRVDAQGPIIEVFGERIGDGTAPILMAGPCSVESEDQILAAAEAVSKGGGRFLRGGAYKPRTSPYSFQGHGEPALRWLRRAADRHGLKVVTEVMRVEDVTQVAEFAHLLQIGSRSMQNFPLLAAAGKTGRSVLLKRGMGATVEEWLHAAEHCLLNGAGGVIFCERGIRGFDPNVRNLIDLGSVALLRHVLNQPVVVDPSHAAGRRDLILPLSKAALAAGAHGLMVEVHPDPAQAQSDGAQALTLTDFEAFSRSLGFA
jgi:3-deoxy-7-phosphoheptulonate synthase